MGEGNALFAAVAVGVVRHVCYANNDPLQTLAFDSLGLKDYPPKARANISRLAVPEKSIAPLSLALFDRCGNRAPPLSATGSGGARFPTSYARRNNP